MLMLTRIVRICHVADHEVLHCLFVLEQIKRVFSDSTLLILFGLCTEELIAALVQAFLLPYCFLLTFPSPPPQVHIHGSHTSHLSTCQYLTLGKRKR